jgi:hypothetical protein
MRGGARDGTPARRHATGRRLIEDGASLARENGARALALAARTGDDATLSLLLNRGVPAGPSQALAHAARFGLVDPLPDPRRTGPGQDEAGRGVTAQAARRSGRLGYARAMWSFRSLRQVALVATALLLGACSVIFDADSLRARSADAAADSQTAWTDATADGGLPPEGGSPCSDVSSTRVFCCDFDDGGTCGLALMQNSGTIGVVMDGGLSEPGALRSEAPSMSGAAASNGSFASRAATGSFTSTRLRFALFVEQPGTAKAKIAEMGFWSGSRESAVALELLSSGDFDLEVQADPAGDAGPFYTKVAGSTVRAPVGRWVSVEITVDPTARTVSFVVDGSPLVLGGALPVAFISGAPRFEVGFHYMVNPSDARAVRFDNVTFELL